VASVRDVTLPAWNPVPDGDLDVELYHYHRELFTQSPEQYHPASRRLLESASKTNAVAYVETLKRLREARRDVTRVFDEVDVLVLPTMREPAPSMDAVIQGAHRYRRSNVSAFNRFGLPAITVPCGFSPEGLPIGLQIVGGAYQESAVLSLAFAYEQSTEWHLRWPVEFGG
jgi:aspartyl-tRNA(Asn)/glutamyl-tRNA(Gln) amidotransferase subunit A